MNDGGTAGPQRKRQRTGEVQTEKGGMVAERRALCRDPQGGRPGAPLQPGPHAKRAGG